MALPQPYPPTEITYTNWDTVIAAIEARLGTGAVGDLLMADTTVIKTGVAASDYFTIAAVDNDTSAVVELARATGAAEPNLAIGRAGTILSATADGYNLGGTSNEFLNVYIGDAGGLYFGLGQDIYLERISAGLLGVTTGALRLESTNKLYFRDTAIHISSTSDGYLVPDADIGIILRSPIIIIESTNQLQFRDSAIYINSGADGYLDLEADTAIRLNGPIAVATNSITGTADGWNLGSATGEIANAYIGDAGGLYFGLGQDIYLERGSAGVLYFTTGSLDMQNNAIINVGAAGNDFGASNTLVSTTFTDNVIIDNTTTGSTAHGKTLYLRANYNDGSDHEVEAHIQLISSADPYLAIFVDDDGATPSSVEVIRMYDTAFIPASADGVSLGNASNEWSNLYIGDAGGLYFGLGQDIYLERISAGLLGVTTGELRLESTNKLYFRDSAIYIYSNADASLTIESDSSINLSIGGTIAQILSGGLSLNQDLIIADTMSLRTPNVDSDYIIIKARDTGVGLLEVGRIAGAADPYFSMGGSQQNKFFNSGGAAFTADAITATDAGVAASLNTITTNVTTNADGDLDNVTLANGVAGQVKIINCIAGTFPDTWKITPATMAGGTQITFNTPVGTGAVLVYNATSGWVVTSTMGGVVT